MTKKLIFTPAVFNAAVASTTIQESKTLDAARLVLVDGWPVGGAAREADTTRQYVGIQVRKIKRAALGQGVCPLCGHIL